jgi:hypothetical protein
VKARSKELLDQATVAMLAAIEIYNKPQFAYRAQSFAILALNGWELLLKAKWLTVNKNRLSSLYVRQGGGQKRKRFKKTRSGNPMTQSVDYLADRMREKKLLAENAHRNLRVLTELRDSAVHFSFNNAEFEKRVHEVCAATVKNFHAAAGDWFGEDLSRFNLYLMPLGFVAFRSASAAALNSEEKRVLKCINTELASGDQDQASPYAVAVSVELRFVRSKAETATAVRVTTDPNAQPVYLTEEYILERWPWTYDDLTAQC